MIHFCRNVFSVALKGKVKQVAMVSEAIHASKGKRAEEVGKKFKLGLAAKRVKEHIEKALTYYDFRSAHCMKITQ